MKDKPAIKKIYFTQEHIVGIDDNGKEWPQSLLWYPGLKNASAEERNNYAVGFDGYHWRTLDVDVSFESFFYTDAVPTPFQHFFFTHPEIKLSEFASFIGIEEAMLKQYINGIKQPSKRMKEKILDGIHGLYPAPEDNEK